MKTSRRGAEDAEKEKRTGKRLFPPLLSSLCASAPLREEIRIKE
jgi:hypothetical protein